MSNFVFVGPPKPLDSATIRFFKFKDYEANSAGVIGSGTVTTATILEAYGVELATTISFDRRPTSKHIVSGKYQWSLDGTTWFEYVPDVGNTTPMTSFVESAFPDASASVSAKNVAQTTFTLTQFLNAPEYNYDKSIQVRVVLTDWFGKEYTTPSVFTYSIKASNKAWFNVSVQNAGEGEEIDTLQSPNSSIPGAKAYAEIIIDTITNNSALNDFRITVAGIDVWFQLPVTTEITGAAAASFLYNNIQSEVIAGFDMYLSSDTIQFKRTSTGVNPVALGFNATFTSNIGLSTNYYNGTNDILYELFDSNSNRVKVFFNVKSFAYIEQNLDTPNNVDVYKIIGGVHSLAPVLGIFGNVIKVLIPATNLDIVYYIKHKTLNLFSNQVIAQSKVFNPAVMNSIEDNFQRLINAEVNYAILEYNSFISNFNTDLP